MIRIITLQISRRFGTIFECLISIMIGLLLECTSRDTEAMIVEQSTFRTIMKLSKTVVFKKHFEPRVSIASSYLVN